MSPLGSPPNSASSVSASFPADPASGLDFSRDSACESGGPRAPGPYGLSESAVLESVEQIEEIVEYYGGAMPLSLLQQVLFRIDRSFFCSLFDSFSGLQQFLSLFPRSFSIGKHGDRVFVQLLQRPALVQGASVGNSTEKEFYRDSNVALLDSL